MRTLHEEALKGCGSGVITSESSALRIEVNTGSPDKDEAWERFLVAAPAMARALLAVYGHDKRFRENPEDANRSPIEDVAAALTLAGIPLP